MSARNLFRVAAVLLLMLGATDLAFPQICGEDSGPVFPQEQRASWSVGEDGDPSRVPLREDDCFCCCSHILSAEGQPVQGLALVTGSPYLHPHTTFFSPARSLFRPPRLA